jgi:hypothetical protein
MRTIRLTGFGFVLFCRFLSNSIAAGQPPAQNQPTQVQKGYCQASSSDQAKIYFSDIFESNVPYKVIAAGGIENLFGAYLKQSYGYNSSPVTPVACVFLQSVAAAEESKRQAQARYTNMGKQLVETRWKLSPQQAGALPTSTPPCFEHDANNPNCEQTGPSAAPKPTLYEVCRVVTSVQTAGKRTTYFSDVMPRANINDADYAAAFAAFLAKKYEVQGISPDPSMCAAVHSQTEGQKLMEVGWWKVNPNFSTSVQTGWTYSPANPFASPAPAASAQNARPQPAAAAPAASAAPAPPAKSVPAAPVSSTKPATTTQQSATSQPSARPSYGVCQAISDPHTAYFSAPFQVPNGNSSQWEQAFAQFLQKKYQYTGYAGCARVGSLSDAQAYIKQLDDAVRPTKKIVETGWGFK